MSHLCARFFKVCVRHSERRSGMFFSKPNPERAVCDLAAQESQQADEHGDELLPDGNLLPAPAGHFGITDPQQWIDLCA
jgi:hypothetical protein